MATDLRERFPPSAGGKTLDVIAIYFANRIPAEPADTRKYRTADCSFYNFHACSYIAQSVLMALLVAAVAAPCYHLPPFLITSFRVHRTPEIPVLLLPSFGLPRRKRRSPRRPIDRRGDRRCTTVAVAILAVSLAPFSVGCATFGRRGTTPEQIAAGRELSRQAVTAMEIGQWAQAEALLRQALETAPDDAQAHHDLARALWHREATDQALSHMAEAMRLDPNDPILAVRAGEMSLALGAHQDALSHAERAIGLDPKLSVAWALRGRVYWRLNQSDQAIADLQRALELDPECSDVLLDVALIYRQRGRPVRSLAVLHNLLDTYRPGEEPQLALLLEGRTLLELGRPHQAVESLLAASRRGPPNAEVFFHLAQAQSAAGRNAEATAAAEQALAIDTSHQASRQLLIELARGSRADAQRR
jgi:tetratricopeptide (TPR) repeat protein